MTINPENEALLILANTEDLNNAACILTCWAGPDHAPDIEIQHIANTLGFVVDKTWCTTQGPLTFAVDGPNMCPLTGAQTIPAGVEPCNAATCALGPTYTVDQSGNPVKVIVNAPTGHLFTINWGTGYAPTQNVSAGTEYANTYLAEGAYQVRVQDQTTGAFGKPTWVIITPDKVPGTVTISCPPDQTSQVGAAVTVNLSASGSNPDVPAVYEWSATGLPAGVSLTPNGATAVLSGAVTSVQRAAEVTVTATDADGHKGTCGFMWTVNEASTVTVTAPADQSSAVGTTITPVQVVATDSDPAITSFTWAAAGLPAGLVIDPAGGAITGTPTTGQASSDVTVTATDRNGAIGTATFKWSVSTTVSLAGPLDQMWTSGTAITPVTPSASDSDRSVTSFVWSISPTLPAGVTLDPATGAISGTPAHASAEEPYTVTATDPLGASASATFNITVANTVSVTSVPDQTWTHGTSITPVSPSAADSDTSVTVFTWSVSPTLPSGVTLDPATGQITGTPAAAAVQSRFTVTATDATGAAGSASFNITVS